VADKWDYMTLTAGSPANGSPFRYTSDVLNEAALETSDACATGNFSAESKQAMLPLDHDQIADLVTEAQLEWPLLPYRKCGFTPCDYCPNCGGFYFIHARACHLHVAKHHGHRCVLVPFVELC
jgi:hypothetical protein